MCPAFNILIHIDFWIVWRKPLAAPLIYITLTTGAFKMSSYNLPSHLGWSILDLMAWLEIKNKYIN